MPSPRLNAPPPRPSPAAATGRSSPASLTGAGPASPTPAATATAHSPTRGSLANPLQLTPLPTPDSEPPSHHDSRGRDRSSRGKDDADGAGVATPKPKPIPWIPSGVVRDSSPSPHRSPSPSRAVHGPGRRPRIKNVAAKVDSGLANGVVARSRSPPPRPRMATRHTSRTVKHADTASHNVAARGKDKPQARAASRSRSRSKSRPRPSQQPQHRRRPRTSGDKKVRHTSNSRSRRRAARLKKAQQSSKALHETVQRTSVGVYAPSRTLTPQQALAQVCAPSQPLWRCSGAGGSPVRWQVRAKASAFVRRGTVDSPAVNDDDPLDFPVHEFDPMTAEPLAGAQPLSPRQPRDSPHRQPHHSPQSPLDHIAEGRRWHEQGIPMYPSAAQRSRRGVRHNATANGVAGQGNAWHHTMPFNPDLLLRLHEQDRRIAGGGARTRQEAFVEDSAGAHLVAGVAPLMGQVGDEEFYYAGPLEAAVPSARTAAPTQPPARALAPASQPLDSGAGAGAGEGAGAGGGGKVGGDGRRRSPSKRLAHTRRRDPHSGASVDDSGRPRRPYSTLHPPTADAVDPVALAAALRIMAEAARPLRTTQEATNGGTQERVAAGGGGGKLATAATSSIARAPAAASSQLPPSVPAAVAASRSSHNGHAARTALHRSADGEHVSESSYSSGYSEGVRRGSNGGAATEPKANAAGVTARAPQQPTVVSSSHRHTKQGEHKSRSHRHKHRRRGEPSKEPRHSKRDGHDSKHGGHDSKRRSHGDHRHRRRRHDRQPATQGGNGAPPRAPVADGATSHDAKRHGHGGADDHDASDGTDANTGSDALEGIDFELGTSLLEPLARVDAAEAAEERAASSVGPRLSPRTGLEGPPSSSDAAHGRMAMPHAAASPPTPGLSPRPGVVAGSSGAASDIRGELQREMAVLTGLRQQVAALERVACASTDGSHTGGATTMDSHTADRAATSTMPRSEGRGSPVPDDVNDGDAPTSSTAHHNLGGEDAALGESAKPDADAHTSEKGQESVGGSMSSGDSWDEELVRRGADVR